VNRKHVIKESLCAVYAGFCLKKMLCPTWGSGNGGGDGATARSHGSCAYDTTNYKTYQCEILTQY